MEGACDCPILKILHLLDMRTNAKSFDQLVDGFDKPTRCIVTSLRYNKPVEQPNRRIKGGQRYGVFVRGGLMERRD